MNGPHDRVSFGEISFIFLNTKPDEDSTDPPLVEKTNFPPLVCSDYKGVRAVLDGEAGSEGLQSTQVSQLAQELDGSTHFSNSTSPALSSSSELVEAGFVPAASLTERKPTVIPELPVVAKLVLKQVYQDVELTPGSPLNVLEGIDDTIAETLQNQVV